MDATQLTDTPSDNTKDIIDLLNEQSDYLSKINSKLTFFVVLTVIGLVITVLSVIITILGSLSL